MRARPITATARVRRRNIGQAPLRKTGTHRELYRWELANQRVMQLAEGPIPLLEGPLAHLDRLLLVMKDDLHRITRIALAISRILRQVLSYNSDLKLHLEESLRRYPEARLTCLQVPIDKGLDGPV